MVVEGDAFDKVLSSKAQGLQSRERYGIVRNRTFDDRSVPFAKHEDEQVKPICVLETPIIHTLEHAADFAHKKTEVPVGGTHSSISSVHVHSNPVMR